MVNGKNGKKLATFPKEIKCVNESERVKEQDKNVFFWQRNSRLESQKRLSRKLARSLRWRHFPAVIRRLGASS